MIGAHGVVIAGEDISCLVDTVSINHGRDDTTSQPEASSATINFTVLAPDVLPLTIDVGSGVLVTTTTAAGASTRFRGKVTDITLSWEEAGEDTPDHGVGQIIATGTIAEIGRRVVGDEPFPQELDGARVSRVMALAGVPMDPLMSDPGVADVLPRDIDSRAALEVAHAAAASALGVLWTDRDGNVRYADAQHRRGIPVGLVLDSCDILITPQWKRTTEGLTNKVSIGYGVAPEDEEGGGGEQPRYVAERPDSIIKWGTFDYSSTTELADAAAAQRMGEIVLARNAEPVWIMSDLPVDVPTLDPARYEALLDLDMHSLISLTGLPSLGHAPTSATLWVEGYTETLAYGTHDITLTVSGYCRTVPPTQWDNVDPDWMWGGGEKAEGRRNLFVNPGLTSDASHWYVNTHWGNHTLVGSVVPGGDGPPIGRDIPYYRATWSVDAGWNAGAGIDINSPAGDGIRLIEDGAPFVATAWVRYSGPECYAWILGQTYGDSSNQYVPDMYGETALVGAGHGWVKLRCSGVLPAGGTRFVMHVTSQGSGPDNTLPTPAGTTWDVAAPIFEHGTEGGDYFDGDSPDTSEIDYQWAGARGASHSVQMVSEPLKVWKAVRRNLFHNPSGEYGSNSWAVRGSDGGMTVVPQTDLVGFGVQQFEASWTLPVADGQGGVGSIILPVVGGTTYTYRAWLRSRPAAFQVAPVHRWFKDGEPLGPTVFGPTEHLPFNEGYSIITGQGTAPIDANGVRAGWAVMSGLAADDGVTSYLAWEAAQLEAVSSLGAYFDGDTADREDRRHSWEGALGTSSSVMEEWVVAVPVVPPTLQWDQTACLGPPVDQGRWDDQPSTLRWDQLGSTGWDAYTTEGA